MFRRAFLAAARRLGVALEEVRHDVAAASLPRFANQPRGLRIELPRTIANASRIFVGDHVVLGPGSLLIAVTAYPGVNTRRPDATGPLQRFDPVIRIGDRVTSTGGLQLAAHESITIEEDVLFATNVNLTDGLHGYDTANEPYKYQPISQIAPIRIGRGCWIGQNVVVRPGVTIGELCIVGANSVVTRSVPARSIAVGAPARVIKRWDEARQQWVPADAPGKEV